MTPQWVKQSQRYRRAAEADAAELDACFLRAGQGKRRGWSLDFSEQAAEEMYRYESYGEGDCSSGIFANGRINGYAHGKHMLNLQFDAWREGIALGLTTKQELLTDPTLDQAWLAEVLPTIPAAPLGHA